MSYFEAFARFLGALESDETARTEMLPATSQSVVRHAEREYQDPMADLREYWQEKDKAHRLEQFAKEMQIFYRDRQFVNKLEAIEARLAAEDAAEGTTWRMDKVNSWKQQVAEARQEGGDEPLDLTRRR